MDQSAPSVPIIKHPDVRRNLLRMKSYVDGMRSFFYYMIVIATQGNIAEKEEYRERHADLFSMLTPADLDNLIHNQLKTTTSLEDLKDVDLISRTRRSTRTRMNKTTKTLQQNIEI